ncbi:Periplasmic binding protein/LacI transcriptional regulator [Fulvimarina pelagi HTCC2506]|uniref:Periplasmic binding protein/LacI transcriptional regulator n=2 Tax=Fulvimarina pelagi TaxID=217511 RepID=Q0G1R1_9HYPH|nr:D-ribose ABC transporter substrate-binding protein [Fulvimarina pelagi]EAU41020.1 Periplasmic binding protein/LacI transcriptional regulator [Fulvimarina pelagi HTCC2506]BAT30961.1 periplasmic binding protein/LacI transcriptional regulator [Fulvimarina pelagi]
MLTITRRVAIAAMASATLLAGAGVSMAQDKGLMTIIVNDPANPYWKTEGDVAQATAEEMGYQASVSAHKGDTNVESNLIDTAITNQSAAILLDPANADGSIGAVKKAVDAGIPVFLINAEINETGLAKAQLVSNNAQCAADGAVKWVELAGDDAQYVEFFGNPADNNAATRSNGYETVLSQYPDLEKLAQETANWDRTQGYNKMQSILQANPNVGAVISGNDEMALGAIAALKEAGKFSEGMVVGGFDGNPDAVDSVKAGEMSYTVLQPVAEFAAEAVRQADALIQNGTEPETEKQQFNCSLITPDNVDQMTGPFTLGS